MKKFVAVLVCAVLALDVNVSSTEVLKYKGEEMTPQRFLEMCNAGALDDVKAVAALGVDVNMHVENGKTFLMFLAQENLPVAIKTLVAAGGDLEARDDWGDTPLMVAIYNGSALAVDALIECGADVNTVNDYGVNALDLAERKGIESITKTLRDAGAKAR